MRIVDGPPPTLPLEAAVILPFASTVILAEVYEPGVTAVFARVVAKLPVPLPVTSHVSVIVWSPVLFQEVLERTAFSASVTKFSSAPRERETTGLTGSVSSTAILVPATTVSTAHPPVPPTSFFLSLPSIQSKTVDILKWVRINEPILAYVLTKSMLRRKSAQCASTQQTSLRTGSYRQ